ncbi:DUF2254 domain-containing protein [Stutzerimonas stutzeri]|uniref:DUF2254 domain-containing protein n=1 Tax=Stutzerimonas stutzeri TaxID=316 RepID=UPI000357687F|nr:hypothetical protein B382_03280 [Stutzerimonas stutzeri B1SMN1]
MSAPSNALFRQLQRIPQSIVFYPTVIPAGYFMLGGLVLLFETTDLAHAWRNMLPPGLAEADNAREILGTLITSIISLTVFSFSMVMVVLNGAASRLSPRVLPGLISDRRNQLILGNYLGCILFFLLMIAFINKNEPDSLPAFGVLLAVLMGLGCMALFVVFIRSISQSIQVDWIVGQLYRSACHNLAQRCERLGSITAAPDDRDWYCIEAVTPGYLREVNEQRLRELLGPDDLQAVLQVEPGFFLVEGHPLLKVSAELDARRTRQVLDCFDFHDEEFAGANVFYAMRQMTEIAVKAISPSINDPGTAIRVLNLHGVLLGRLGGVPPLDVGCIDNGKPRLFYPQLSPQRRLTLILDPIRTYGSNDPAIVMALMQCLKTALHGQASSDQLEAYVDELAALRDAADTDLRNDRDRRAVNDLLERINRLHDELAPLALLPIPAKS